VQARPRGLKPPCKETSVCTRCAASSSPGRAAATEPPRLFFEGELLERSDRPCRVRMATGRDDARMYSPRVPRAAAARSPQQPGPAALRAAASTSARGLRVRAPARHYWRRLLWLVALVSTFTIAGASANRFRLPSLLSSNAGLTPAQQPVVVRTQQLAQVSHPQLSPTPSTPAPRNPDPNPARWLRGERKRRGVGRRA
jgi:hypothetical protein